jgi:PIN domain nuclease of toxin-antitoxin system
MNLLLDTHIVIWFITNDDKLSKKVKDLIEDSKNKCFVSIASYWELSIKYALGRYTESYHPTFKARALP